MDLGPSDHQSSTCFNHDLSNDGRLRFNRGFDDSSGDMCLHKIGQAKKRENVGLHRGIMAHLKRAIVAVQPIFIRSSGLQFLQGFLL